MALAPAGPAPTMFAAGDWPLFTSSGLDVDVLGWVPWKLRHAAALTTSRALVMRIVEEGAEDAFDPEDLQTEDGRVALAGNFDRVRRWAIAPDFPGVLDSEVSAMFPSDVPLGE